MARAGKQVVTPLNEHQQFAAPGSPKYRKLPCNGRSCGKCGQCRDWRYIGDSTSWIWIRSMRNWKNADWERWDTERVWKRFERRDDAKCSDNPFNFDDLRRADYTDLLEDGIDPYADIVILRLLNINRGVCFCTDNIKTK